VEFIIIGTAGHVDHGKTKLVKALTGVDTDRLKEEKERGISIELGFAPLTLPGGVVAGIIDVPGHERFVKNMLAGAGGVDLVLLVIAADEGVMPQTSEHLNILELLHVQKAIVVITKTDLVEAEWSLMVEDDVRSLLKGSRFEDAPIVPVSVVSGAGLEDLRRLLGQMAHQVEPKPRVGDARLPIDRIFSIIGFGTVLTGTLFSGRLQLGDILSILPSGRQGRVRSLQVHGHKVEEALAGQRVAVNLVGVEVGQVERGEVLVTPEAFTAVRRVTVSLQLLKRVQKPLKNWQRLRFHLGTKETLARLRLLDRDEQAPGEEAPAQLELEEPVVVAVHDRFVIRSYSPVTTIGGGEIVEVGGLRHKRFRADLLEGLERKLTGNPYTRVEEELRGGKVPVMIGDLAARSGLAEIETRPILDQMAESGSVQLFTFGSEVYVVATALLKSWQTLAEPILAAFHHQYPLRAGYPKEEMRTKVFGFLSSRLYQSVLDWWVSTGKIAASGQVLQLPDFTVRLQPQQDVMISSLREEMRAQLFRPPAEEEIRNKLGGDADLLQYCLQNDILVKVGDDLIFLSEAVEKAWVMIRDYLLEHGQITIAEARDCLHTSRRYCLPLLEYFDCTHKTRRSGDLRTLLEQVR
jgi:selenocysteine-specific elongation factor